MTNVFLKISLLKKYGYEFSTLCTAVARQLPQVGPFAVSVGGVQNLGKTVHETRATATLSTEFWLPTLDPIPYC